MRKETLVLGSIGLFTLILLVGAAFLLGGKDQQQSSEAPVDNSKLIGERRHAIGSESAKVTIVEFADFQCPACGAAHPITQQILDKYAGQVEFVFRHFPLPGHKNARVAAQAAEAAGQQGKFFEMHDKLYENQDEWSESNNAKDIFKGYAEDLGLNSEQFAKDLDNKELAQKIQEDLNAGIDLGVNSTPTFYINGEKHPGVLSFDSFSQLIDDELKQK